MNILFIYTVQKSLLKEKPLKGQEDIQMGIAQLSSVLKEANHSTDLLVLDKRNKKYNFDVIEKKVTSTKYDIVAFSSVFSEFSYITEIALYIKKKYNLFTVLGGVHATISPKESYLDLFNALCIGEGERALLDLANKMQGNESIFNIANLWFKENGTIIKNPTIDFFQDLDTLPFVDRELWQPHIFNTNSRLTLLLGRGCPYNCTYCCNHAIKQVAKGKYVRLRSPQNIVSELKYLTSKFPSVTEYFLEVETLGADIDWLIKLCESLNTFNEPRETKLTFSANLRVYNNLDVELVFKNLKKANFSSIIIGLESGNERIRKEILNRNYSNETIFKAVETARKYKIKIGLFNLMGLPTETNNDFLDTLRINQEIQPDWHATSIFFPYKGTKLYEISKELGLLPGKINFQNERQHAILELPDFNKRLVQKQFDSFHYNVYMKAPNRKLLKSFIYFIQTLLGHNFMANAKNRLIIILYRMKIETRLTNIIQKI